MGSASAAPAADRVRAAQIAGLWAGMGSIVETTRPSGAIPIIVKRIRPGACASLGDRRKKASYEVEANFYSPGARPTRSRPWRARARARSESARPRGRDDLHDAAAGRDGVARRRRP